MKVAYPLSLKVSLWLMLNLLLLAALGLGFFVINGGIRWDALVSGPSGARVQALANVIAGEAAAATGDARTAVLKRFGTAYRADFYLFSLDEGQISGAPVELPDEVHARMGLRTTRKGGRGLAPRSDMRRPPGSEPDSARKRDPAEKEKTAARDPLEKADNKAAPRDTAEKTRPASDPARRDSPAANTPPVPEVVTGRFVVRAGSPAAYWIGLRVPFVPAERGRFIPARMIVRVGSMWSLLHLLNLQSWVLAGTCVLALSVLFWLPLVRGITRSVSLLTLATEQIAEGRFETRVTTRRRDELGQLGDAVNRMATRLDAHMTGQKRFLGDVAHELCSPLARLQMATGILADQAPENLQATVADVREEVQQMSTLVNELLAFTKAGLQPRNVPLVAIDLPALVVDVLTRENAGERVTMNLPAGLRAMAEPDLLARALGNLVRNAIRYAGDAGPIAVTAAREEKNRVAIVVQDEGPGVPSGDLDRLGEPFFRPELARTRESGGVGLGLAIVRNSIAACGGDVRFANRTPRGFHAEIRLAAT